MELRVYRHRARSYLISDVPVCRDPVAAYETRLYLPLLHQQRSRIVADERHVYPRVVQLERGQPGSLKQRARFVAVNVELIAALPSEQQRAEPGAVLHRRECPRIAVGEYSVAAFHQGKPVFRDSSAGGYVLVANSRALAPEGGKQLIPGTIAAFRAG